MTLQWSHNGRHGVSNHLHLDCLLSRLFRRISKNTSKLRVTGLCDGNPPVTGGYPSQRASNSEFFSIWWRHHNMERFLYYWPFKGNTWSPPGGNPHTKGIQCAAYIFNLICWQSQQAVEQTIDFRWFETSWCICDVTMTWHHFTGIVSRESWTRRLF